jgi:hypothetical protein
MARRETRYNGNYGDDDSSALLLREMVVNLLLRAAAKPGSSRRQMRFRICADVKQTKAVLALENRKNQGRRFNCRMEPAYQFLFTLLVTAKLTLTSRESRLVPRSEGMVHSGAEQCQSLNSVMLLL